MSGGDDEDKEKTVNGIQEKAEVGREARKYCDFGRDEQEGEREEKEKI